MGETVEEKTDTNGSFGVHLDKLLGHSFFLERVFSRDTAVEFADYFSESSRTIHYGVEVFNASKTVREGVVLVTSNGSPELTCSVLFPSHALYQHVSAIKDYDFSRFKN